ncbi:MAG: CotH kinase family protein [Flavobacteriales bacterium]|nr:CotH kinase family protein [Flavobacteriales bacterium]
MEQASTHGRATAVLIGGVLASAACALILPSPPRMPAPSTKGEAPLIEPATAYVEAGDAITIRAAKGDRLWVEHDGAFYPTGDVDKLVAEQDQRAAAHALAIPTAMQWRHPLPGLPAAMLVRAAQAEGNGMPGPLATRTFLFTRHSPLPVVSISAKDDDLFSADEGIMVPGHWMMHPDEGVLTTYLMDIRWWKYPGNYHGRGLEWQRPARIELIDADGREILQADAGLRINGQMTRGFPQHALRLVFDEPLAVAPFADGDGIGSRALVLRAAGNDQVKAMLRDAYQHRLCEGLPFETSKARTCVVYINGVYQGVHHLRQRMDEEELARRHGIKKKRITLIEDANELCYGDSTDVKRFAQMMARTEKWDVQDPAWLDTLEAQLDVDGFLTYMASQMILGNMDWPKQNVKYWRYTGKPKDDASLDGRWHFIMGDTDLSFGANASASADMFAKVHAAGIPVSRLFMAMMRSPLLKMRFIANARKLLDGPLSAGRCLSELDHFAADMDGEMERHTARWRKPLDKSAWLSEVDLMRQYAKEREGHVRQQLIGFEAQ